MDFLIFAKTKKVKIMKKGEKQDPFPSFLIIDSFPVE